MIEWEAEATDAVGHDEANCARTRQDEREWHAALSRRALEEELFRDTRATQRARHVIASSV